MPRKNDQQLAEEFPDLTASDRRFIRYFGAFARMWGTPRYHRLDTAFFREFPPGKENETRLSRITDIVLGKAKAA